MDTDSYDVQVLSGKRWVVQTVCASELSATKLLKELAATGQYEGVRVVRDRTWADGRHTEKVLVTEMCELQAVSVQIVPVNDTAPCERPEDLYVLEARMTIGRMLRKYLDKVQITPMELLYNYGAATRFMETDMLLMSSVDRIATLQAAGRDDLDTKTRANELRDYIDRVTTRALRAEGRKVVRKAKVENLDALRDLLKPSCEVGEEDYLLRVVMARELVGRPSFLGKFEWLIGLIDERIGAEALEALDEFVADVLGVPSVIQDLLGPQRNLSSALVTLIDLMEGKLEEGSMRPAMPESVQMLHRLMKEKKLPRGAKALMDRVRRQVESTHPLARNDPEEEERAFDTLLGRLMGAEGLRGGPTMAAAMTRRYGLRVQEGGQTGEEKSIKGLAAMFDFLPYRMRFLVQLMRTDYAVHDQVIVRLLAKSLAEANKVGIRRVLPRKWTPKRKLTLMTDLQRELLAAPFAAEDSKRLVALVDDMLAEYLIKDGVVEKLDNPNDPIRSRALRLVQFCGSGLLLEGKALTVARGRVVQHLKQPKFIEKFTEDIPETTAQEKAVRDFYQLLAEAGFGKVG